MAGRYEAKLNADRQKLKKSIEDLNTRRSNTSDSTQKRRLNTQIKGKTRQLNDLNQRSSGMRTGIDPKGGSKKRIPSQPTKQAHHYGSSLNNASTFFADLDPAEKILMEQKMVQYGIIPGDVTMNRLDMFTDLHQAGIHNLERELGLEGKAYFPAGSSFEVKYNAVEEFAKDQRYLRQIAEEAQFRADNELGGLSRRVEATATSEQASSYHDIERRRIAETTKDFNEYAPQIHEQATALGPQILPDITDRPRLDFSKGSIKLKAVRALPFIGLGVAALVAGEQALAGDLVGAGGTLIDEVVGEVGLDSTPVASGTLTDAPAQHQAILERRANPTVADKIIRDPLNELEYFGKQALSFFGSAVRLASPLGL
tara:strand:+ start:42 stop:1151 length:1110 start_codon:yes stop_codon:yes gene_type:complete